MPSGVFIRIYGTQIELFKTNIENILSKDFVYVWTRIQVKAMLEKIICKTIVLNSETLKITMHIRKNLHKKSF